MKKQNFCTVQACDVTLKSFYHDGILELYPCTESKRPTEVSAWAVLGGVNEARAFGVIISPRCTISLSAGWATVTILRCHALRAGCSVTRNCGKSPLMSIRMYSMSGSQNGIAKGEKSGRESTFAKCHNMIKQFSVHWSSSAYTLHIIHFSMPWPTQFHSEKTLTASTARFSKSSANLIFHCANSGRQWGTAGSSPTICTNKSNYSTENNTVKHSVSLEFHQIVLWKSFGSILTKFQKQWFRLLWLELKPGFKVVLISFFQSWTSLKRER